MKKCHSGIKDQAVIVISLLVDGTMAISSRNNGRSKCAKVADAIVKMSGAVLKHDQAERQRKGDLVADTPAAPSPREAETPRSNNG